MQIAGNKLRFETVQAAKIFYPSLKSLPGFQAVQIAQMLTQENLTTDGDGHRVFQVPAHGKHWKQLARRDDRQRRIAAGAPKNLRASARNAGHGIIAGTRNRAVMQEKNI